MEDTSKAKSEKELFQHLREIGCCKLCCLRYLGVRSQHVYQNPDPTLQMKSLLDVDDTENPTKLKKSNVCTACLGILQENFRETFIEKIVSDVNAANYDCKEFSCALSMPVSFCLRTHSLNLYVDELSPGESDEPAEMKFMSVKEVWKWIAAPLLAKGICKSFKPQDCDFSITISIGYEDDEKECNCLMDMHKEIYEVRKTQKRKFKDCVLSRKSVESLLLSTDSSHFKKFYPTPPNIPNTSFTCCSVTPLHNSVFIAGRYNKYSRKLCQTPWLIDGKKLMETSVQELVCNPIRELAKAEDLRFASSGREDVDVRMLGKGRPFFCELINPHRVQLLPSHFRDIENSISASTKDVLAKHLQIVSKDQVSQVKTGEEDKIKLYCAYCIFSGDNAQVDWEKLNSLPPKCPIVLQQKTPIRVLHRRSMATRERTIFKLEVCKAETKEPKAFVLKMATQAGTYIKEFVHGDFGRTTPSLRDLLGADVDILALDVMDIELDWPPEVNYDDEVKSAIGS